MRMAGTGYLATNKNGGSFNCFSKNFAQRAPKDRSLEQNFEYQEYAKRFPDLVIDLRCLTARRLRHSAVEKRNWIATQKKNKALSFNSLTLIHVDWK